MLKYHEKEKKKVINSWVSKIKTAIGNFLSKNKKRIASISVLVLLCVAFFIFVVPEIKFENYMSFRKITIKGSSRVSEETLRKIIGYSYEERIYLKDTAEIRASLDTSSMIFGEIRFFVSLVPYEFKIEFREACPLFAIMPKHQDSISLIYSDRGKIYPYGTNTADLPIVDAKESGDIVLATDFLVTMRDNDALLYSRVSQLIPREGERQIAVFFNDVDFKTTFSLEKDYWKTAFKHYRQITGNMQVLNINSIAVLDLRFRQLAYTVEKEGRL